MSIGNEAETILFIQSFSNEETEPWGGEAPCPIIEMGLSPPVVHPIHALNWYSLPIAS